MSCAVPTPSRIVAHLDQYVIGQAEAKRTLAVAVYAHFRRLDEPAGETVRMAKSNVLLVGPSGTGKTLACASLARFLDVPFASADATSLAQTRYVNEEVAAILQRLVERAGGDVRKAERGIVFIDEIDKLAAGEAGRHAVSPERVQHALLKIMEGATVRLDDGRHVDTTGILFMCAGAFVGLEKLVAQGDVYGFIATSGDDNRRILDRLNRRVKPTDLVRFGLIPEFTGRLPIVARFRDLAKADLVRVMTEPRDSIHAQFRALFHQEGVELVVAPAVFEQIAEIALGYETGARSLRGLLEELLSPALYVVADDRSVRAVLISSIYDEPRIVRRPVQPTDRTSLDRSRDVAAVDAGAA